MRFGKWAWVTALAVVLAACGAQAVLAGTAGPDGAKPPPGQRFTWWTTIQASGIVGGVIILMSLTAGALIVEHYLSIRRQRILPTALEKGLGDLIGRGNYAAAVDACRKDGSFLARVIQAGLEQRGAMFGFFDMQTAMQEVSEREVARLYRKLEYLALITTTAPMLGLLGTITGMIRSFNVIASTGGSATPAQLAGGISEALVTTFEGLTVAIPCMFFVSQFRTRIESYLAEGETIVERLMGRFRRGTA